MNHFIPRLLTVSFLMSLLCFSQPVFAQNGANIEQELKTLIESFATNYESLPQTKSKQSVLKFVEKDLTFSIFVLTISGSSRAQRGNYAGFEGYLDNVLRAEIETLKYDVSNIRVTQYSETNGTVVYSVNYETKQVDGLWVKGKETVTMALEKVDGTWKIAFYNIIQVEDEKLKGTCWCEIFASQSKEGQLVVKTTIPSGRSYTTHYDNFDFKSVNGETLISTGSYSFKRLNSGQLVALENGEEIELGMVQNRRESVLAVIRNYIYKDSCARLKVK